MRWVLLATLLAGCEVDGNDPGYDTEEACIANGGTIREHNGDRFCDTPPQGHVAANVLSADAGARD